jgi:tetratricopeptide (TPR) repeat protein
MDFRSVARLGILLALAAGVQAREEPAVFKTAQAKAHYEKALAFEDKGLWSPAILELNQARELEPLNPSVLVELGIAHGERKEWKPALASLRKAVAVAPTSARAHYNLALTLDRADPGRGPGISEYWKTLQLDPSHVDALMNLAVDIGDRNAAEAKPLFERAVKIAPRNARLHMNFAVLLNRQAEESASSAEFLEAIRCDPSLLEARRQFISLLISQQQWGQAIEQCREILKREPDDAATHYTLSRALIHNQNDVEGKQELEKSQELRKRHQKEEEALALQREGVRLLRAGQIQDALKSLESALNLDPSAGNHMYFGLALGDSGDIAGAIRELTAAVTLDPRDARVHLNLGSVFLQNGQESAALSEFERALEIDPWLAEAHNNLGMILAKNGEFDKAVKHFRLATDLDPEYVEAEFNLGLGLRNLNRVDDALKAFRRAAALAPDSAQAQYALGMTLRDKGDAAGAKVALDRAAALSRQSK